MVVVRGWRMIAVPHYRTLRIVLCLVGWGGGGSGVGGLPSPSREAVGSDTAGRRRRHTHTRGGVHDGDRVALSRRDGRVLEHVVAEHVRVRWRVRVCR